MGPWGLWAAGMGRWNSQSWQAPQEEALPPASQRCPRGSPGQQLTHSLPVSLSSLSSPTFFLFHEAVITLQPKEIGDPMVEQGVYHLVCPVCPLSLLLCPEKAEMLLDSFLDKYVQSCRPQWPLLGPTEGPDMACKEESGLLDDLV